MLSHTGNYSFSYQKSDEAGLGYAETNLKTNSYLEEVQNFEAPVPVPAAYIRNISYDYSQSPSHSHISLAKSSKSNEYITDYAVSETASTKNFLEEGGGRRLGKRQKPVLIFIRDSRLYIRALAIAIIIVAMCLIITAVVKLEVARKAPGHPLDSVPQPKPITDYPCRVFTGIAAMNLVFSIAIFSLSCVSSKFNKLGDAINAVFAILSAIGFASSMGACFFLKKQNALQLDLWNWSCNNHKNGISNPALDFQLVCEVVNYGWKFGILQASLELFTFIISVISFCILKYSLFVRYGAVGKIF